MSYGTDHARDVGYEAMEAAADDIHRVIVECFEYLGYDLPSNIGDVDVVNIRPFGELGHLSVQVGLIGGEVIDQNFAHDDPRTTAFCAVAQAMLAIAP